MHLCATVELTYKPVHEGKKAFFFWSLIGHILQKQNASKQITGQGRALRDIKGLSV